MSGLSLPHRLVLSAFLVWHLLTMLASLSQETWPGQQLRKLTHRYERTVGVHQNWNMFAPNPATDTEWMRLYGISAKGEQRELTLPDEGYKEGEQIWLYKRAGKLQRNALAQKRDFLRGAFVRWACRESVAEGRPLRKVRVEKMRVPTPPPAERFGHPRSEWPVQTREMETWNCPR